MAFIFLFLFYFFDNINQFINNSHEKTKKALKEAEHQLLRQQFNPHFLYNAFNSLYSMSLQNNPKTSDSILKLSSMMRYLTDDISPSGNLLKQEFKFIKDYIEIEKIRFGEKAKIGFDIIGEVEHQIIEPLILINLVENAFKHGFYTNNSNAFVDIKATVDQSNLSFSVRNSCFKKQHFQESERLGKGIDLLKKRLDLVYPHNAVLTCKQTNEEYVSVLNINLS